MSRNPHPRVQTAMPPGAGAPEIPGSPVESWTPYLQSSPSVNNNQYYRAYASNPTTNLSVPGVTLSAPGLHGRSASMHGTTSGGYSNSQPRFQFPEPQIPGRTVPSTIPIPGYPITVHRYARSDAGVSAENLVRRESMESLAYVRVSSIPSLIEHYAHPLMKSQVETPPDVSALSEELSAMT
jgi:hypothetical protein